MDMEKTCPLKFTAFIGAWIMKYGNENFYEFYKSEEGRPSFIDFTDCSGEGCGWYDPTAYCCAIVRIIEWPYVCT